MQIERISMRTSLEVLNSLNLIITTSIMQSADASLRPRSCIRHASNFRIVTAIKRLQRENQRMSKRDLCLEFLFDHHNKYK